MKLQYISLLSLILGVAFSGCSTKKLKLNLTYNTEPQGALIYCNSKYSGNTPKTFHYEIKSNDKQKGKMTLKSCKIQWISGIIANPNKTLNVDLNRYGLNQQITYKKQLNQKNSKDEAFQKYLKGNYGYSQVSENQAIEWNEQYDGIQKRLMQYEKNYLTEYEKIQSNISNYKAYYFQPINKKEPCKVFMAYDSQKDESSKLYWDGECKNGYATGMGRLIQKADLTDRWQLGLYRKGKVSGYCILNDILHEYKMEGECKYDDTNDYQVKRYIKNTNNDITLLYDIGKFSQHEPDTFIQTSPFWNNTISYLKVYPNFRYEYDDFTKNDEAKLDFGFWIYDKNNVRNGWAIEKYKNQNIVYGEYIDNKGSKINLPQKYIDKANNIINEIKSNYKKALYAQSQAQLIKKQYLRKICKKSVKVSFMDNEEYKEICDSKYEKELFSKINTKLEKLSKEKIARLEAQRFNEQQKQQEQYRQQQLALERQNIEEQRRQAAAAESANTQRYWNSLNQLFQNTNSNRIKQNTNFQLEQINNTLRYGY